MINLYNQVPTIYSEASRDFQYLSWLINIVLNSVKHNVDDLYELPKVDADSKLPELFALTLGFKVRRNYNKDQLLALVNILPELIKCKGTVKALELAGNALIKSSGALGSCIVVDDEEGKKLLKEGIVQIILPKDLVDLTLFNDLLPYIMPAGMSCRVIRKPIETESYETNVSYQSTITDHWLPELKLIEDKQLEKHFMGDMGDVVGVSGLFDSRRESNQTDGAALADIPSFTNYNDDETFNAGLLDNTVIPVLDNIVLRDYNVQKETNNS